VTETTVGRYEEMKKSLKPPPYEEGTTILPDLFSIGISISLIVDFSLSIWLSKEIMDV
jgi:hypothetical protein